MEIVQHLFLVKVKWATVKVKGDMRQTSRIIGKSALAFTGEFNGTL
jgi:hypothetical protein